MSEKPPSAAVLASIRKTFATMSLMDQPAVMETIASGKRNARRRNLRRALPWLAASAAFVVALVINGGAE